MREKSPDQPALTNHRLFSQDIHLRRTARTEGGRVIAEVECVRQRALVNAEACARCPHFLRIETHEAGYLMICRAREEGPEDAKPDQELP